MFTPTTNLPDLSEPRKWMKEEPRAYVFGVMINSYQGIDAEIEGYTHYV
jgi:hypothetical protein